ncbi:LCP family protein [Candidatus Microgenomates bacterium]|nr:LCP family protein [Candidatus Microgenomates bacterium]
MVKKTVFGASLILLFSISFLFGYFIKKTYFAELKNQEGRINFLILGIRGFETNDADLTDTIIFISLDQKNKKAVLLSVPRDLWIEEIQAKINTAYHYGGFDLAKKTIAEVLGQEIDYMVVVNFESFGEIVNVLDGVMINVQRSFDDFRYPIAGKENDLCDGDKEYKCRYEHLHFDAGSQKMDGKTALKYIRSRNAEGEEGTDFARTARQQQLVLALKQKILTRNVYFNPSKVSRLFKVFQEYLVVDINRFEYGNLALLLARIDWNQMKVAALNGNLLTNPKNHYSKQWVLVPESGNWQGVHEFVSSLLK